MTGPEKLIDAVNRGDAGALKDALAQGADPNFRDEQGMTALLHACGRGQTETVRLLLEHGADVHLIDARAGASPLHKAVQSGSLETVRLLVRAGAFIDLQAAGTGHTPLIEAVWFKNVEVVRFLLDQGARIGLKTAYGFTLLDHLNFMLKVNVKERAKISQIMELVDKRTASDRDLIEKQALMAATVANDAGRVKSLLAQGAEVDARSPILAGFNDAHTPLLVAAREGYLEIARLLLEAGADVNAVEPTFGAVPLHKATYNGHAEIVRLLALWPEVDLNYRGSSNGYTPLHDALWHGYGNCARILVETGARLDIAGHDGLYPLELSTRVLGTDDPVTALIRSREQGGQTLSRGA